MKKILIYLGVVCSVGFYSCTKDISSDSLTSADQAKSNATLSINPFDPHGLISPSAHSKMDILGTGFSFTEGPAVDKHGNIFFTDQPNDKIYKYDFSSKQITTFLTGTGRANGMAFDKDGNLIACADLHGEVWKIYPDGSHEVIAKDYGGKILNGPNDVWINPVTGGIYITDPIFPRDYWEAGDPRIQTWEPTHSEQAVTGKGGHVYYLAPGSHTLVRVTTMPGWNADSWPNGIVGTPDGKKLYVNQWSYNNSGGIWSFDINSDGSLSNLQTFVPGLNFLDGMSMDDMGNVYVSGGPGIRAYSPAGDKVLEIPLQSATNNVFGGPNNKILYSTGPVSMLTAIKMNVKGVEKYY